MISGGLGVSGGVMRGEVGPSPLRAWGESHTVGHVGPTESCFCLFFLGSRYVVAGEPIGFTDFFEGV